MDPKQSLILMFIMREKKMHQKKLKKGRQESIIQLLTVRYFQRTLIQRARQAFLQMLNFQTGRRRYWMMQYNQFWFETMWDMRVRTISQKDYGKWNSEKVLRHFNIY